MCQRFLVLSVVALILGSSSAFAQCGCGSAPVYTTAEPTYSANYAPPVADYAPTPYVSYYAPAAAPVSYVSYYAPPVAYAPAPYVSYYAPAPSYATYYSPAPSYTTYYSPSVAYAPAVAPYRVLYGVPGASIYGAPRVYVPGEPVRNTVKALTP
jgi:hypothetical protein